MVMIFDNKKARKFLVEHGYVYTLRRVRRKREGKDWCNYFRTDTKKHNIFVVYEGYIDTNEWLSLYVGESGFDSVEEWRKAAKDSRFLYFVSIIPWLF